MVEVHRNRKDFDCNNCVNSYHCTEIVGDKSWPKSKGAAPLNIFEVSGVIETSVCLRPLITQASVFYFKMHAHYKNGLLPYEGGLLDQSAVYLQAMELIESFS